MNLRSLLCAIVAGCMLNAQALDPKKLLQAPVDTWPTYNGDYSGRRFSPLSRISPENVQSLTLAWVFRTSSTTGDLGGAVKSTPLVVNGILYFSIPDHVFAVDARSGHEIWHFSWPSKGG